MTEKSEEEIYKMKQDVFIEQGGDTCGSITL